MKKTLRKIFYKFSGASKRQAKILLFGAWFGSRFGDNPRYLMSQMLADKSFYNYKFYWIGNKSEKNEVLENADQRVQFVRRNSLKSLILQFQCTAAFFSHGFADLGTFSLLKNAKTFQLWHGFPIKHIGADDPDNPNEGDEIFEEYTYFFADSLLMKRRVISGFRNYGATNSNVIVATQPRVDYLLENLKNEEKKLAIREKLGVTAFDKVITYLPTFRDSGSDIYSFLGTHNFKLLDYLKKNNVIILERQHFAAKSKDTSAELNPDCRVVEVSPDIDTQDLLLCTDILISDFSSVYVDFSFLNRPIIHFLFDGDSYITSDRGLYTDDFSREKAGPVAYDEDQLVDCLINIDEEYEKHLGKFHDNVQSEKTNRLISFVESSLR